MADHSSPDYELEDVLSLETPEQYRALFEDTRLRIVELLLERSATVSELAETLDRPKGTIGHHVSTLEEAGLVRVVRTRKVRAIEAKYYGRTARTFLLAPRGDGDIEMTPDYFLTTAADEYAKAAFDETRSPDLAMVSTLRYARIPDDRATEWALRLGELAAEFTAEPCGGETTFAMILALYPTDRPHLPDRGRKR